MAIEQNIQYDEAGLEALGHMNRPIPGQSLTANPDEPYSWESPPEFTRLNEALDYVLDCLIEEKTYTSIVGSIGEGIPISDIVQQIMYMGFSSGKWNPDLMLLLVEPLMYMIMSLCEKAGVEYKLYRGEEEDDEADDIEGALENKTQELQTLANLIEQKAGEGNITSASVPREIAQEIQQAEVPESLMARPQEQQEEAPASLMAR